MAIDWSHDAIIKGRPINDWCERRYADEGSNGPEGGTFDWRHTGAKQLSQKSGGGKRNWNWVYCDITSGEVTLGKFAWYNSGRFKFLRTIYANLAAINASRPDVNFTLCLQELKRDSSCAVDKKPEVSSLASCVFRSSHSVFIQWSFSSEMTIFDFSRLLILRRLCWRPWISLDTRGYLSSSK